MLAIICALEEWRHFLEGAKHHVKVWTDHKNLEYFQTAKKLNQRQAWWSLYLSCFNFELQHRPGHTMGKLDALSHCLDHGLGSGDNSNMILLYPELFAVHALEGLTLVGEEHGIVGDIREAFGKEVVEDEAAVAVRKLQESGGKSLVSSKWAKNDGLLMFRGKTYVPDVKDLQR